MDFQERALRNAQQRRAVRANVWPASGLITPEVLLGGAAIKLIGHIEKRPTSAILLERASDDALLPLILRATQGPASSTVAGWAAELSSEVIGAFQDWIQADAVLPRLQTMTFEFGNAGKLILPRRKRQRTPNLAGAFRAEGAPIRIGALPVEAVTLTPKSLGVIGDFTREMARRSVSDIVVLLDDAMRVDTAAKLDAIFLDANPGDSIRPPGIQNGIPPGNTGASTGASPAEIRADTKAMLKRAIARGGSLARLAWVMSANNLVALQLAAGTADAPAFPSASASPPTLGGVPIVASVNFADDVVLLVDGQDIWFAMNPPVFDAADSAVLHEEDAAPLPIGTPGTPPVIAAPARSLWQTNSAGLRMVAEADWSITPGSVQRLTGVAW